MYIFTRHTRRSGAVALALSVMMLVFAVPAYAPTSTNTMTVSCDGVTIKEGVVVTHDPAGTFKIKQNSTVPTSSSWVTARSEFNNELGFKLVSDGTTQTWTGVKVGTYTVRAHRSGSSNCNGWLPGHGNYTLNYTVTYN